MLLSPDALPRHLRHLSQHSSGRHQIWRPVRDERKKKGTDKTNSAFSRKEEHSKQSTISASENCLFSASFSLSESFDGYTSFPPFRGIQPNNPSITSLVQAPLTEVACITSKNGVNNVRNFRMYRNTGKICAFLRADKISAPFTC